MSLVSTPDTPSTLTPLVWTLGRGAGAAALERTMRAFGVSAPVAQVLWSRGITPEMLEAPRRLNPSGHLRAAARQLAAAIRRGARIRVHGDYDADGVTASATLMRAIRELGGDVHGFIPHRTEDGYGLNMKRVPEHAAACDLLVSVDCGVTAVKEVQALLDLGCEVIITDHHAPGEGFPDCVVVHPQLTDEEGGYDPAVHNLTGAGVAYHLAWALRQELAGEHDLNEHETEPLHLAPIATIGTIADVAPLLGENRALCLAGLAHMATSPVAGLQALTGPRDPGPMSARDVAFGMAPRLNAAGRMGQADVALELLLTDSPARAAQIMEELEALNKERRQIQDRMYEQALELADPREQIMLVTHPEWNPGVMGIVASKLLERFGRPVFIVAQGKGSARSMPGINAVDALHHSSDLMIKYGGHPGAAGFSIDPGNVEAFRARLQEFAAQFPAPVRRAPVDAPLGDCDHLGILEELDALEPFGHGIPAPRWHLRATPEAPRLVGSAGRSLQLTVQGVKGIKHGHDDGLPSGLHDISAQLGRNEWRGQVSPQWQCEQLSSSGQLDLDLSDLSADMRERVAQTVNRIGRCTPREGIELAQQGWEWHAEDPGLREYLGQTITGTPTQGAGIVCFDVPHQSDLSRWLRERRTLKFAFGPNTLRAMAQTYTESYDPTRAAEQAQAYSLLRWGHGFRVLSDAGFAADVLSLAGALQAPAVVTEH